ncbi:MAG: restriction endonuclease [Mesorhizobium sp.]|nr:MAG: restriction endonuclease [Mesorhizobium sp.]
MTGETTEWPDAALQAGIGTLQSSIREWAIGRDLWFECSFKSYFEHVDAEPKDPAYVTLLILGGDLCNVLMSWGSDEEHEEFFSLIDALGYRYEYLNGYTLAFYAADELLASAFLTYFHWQWVCSLVKEDTADVYHELYGHFAHRPDDLHRLHWREFEILLFRIFQSQGFAVELGPGRGDVGVDLRLWQRDPIGDILTLVQAKRYAAGNKIDLTQVAALYGISAAESADKALFVTTSSYLPVARRFANRVSGALELAEQKDIANWCARATAGVIADKSSLVAKETVGRLITDLASQRDHRLLCASFGYNATHNDFALVVKESNHAALLMRLGSITISDDGYGQRGTEIPRLDGTTIERLNGDMVWRAKRKMYDSGVGYWDGEHLYSPWDGKPREFEFD